MSNSRNISLLANYISAGGILSQTNVLPTQTNNSGKYLTTNGTTASWATVDALPSQTGNTGKYLTTNGTITSWATVDALPSQTGNSGKYLTTNGTTASWATVSGGSLPTQTGNSGKILITDGSTANWGLLTNTGFSDSAFDLQGKSFVMFRGQTTVGGSSNSSYYPSGYGWQWAGTTTVCGLVASGVSTTVKNLYNQPNGLLIIEMTAADAAGGAYGNITNGGHEIWSVQVAHHGWSGGSATLLNSKGTLHGSYTNGSWYQIIITGGSGSGTYYRITWIN
jgi:hypothetical protein